MTSWLSAVRDSVDVLQRMTNDESFRMYDNTNLDGCLNAQCSLLLHHNVATGCLEACIASWVKPFRSLSGRAVALDDNNRIIYPSHFVERNDFSTCFMMIPSIGARVRKSDREQVQPWVLRFRNMLEVCIDGGITHADSAKCAACTLQQHRHHHEESLSWPSGVHQCAFCLQFFHKSCSQQMADNIASFRETTSLQFLSELSMRPGDLPFPLLFRA